MKRDLTDTLRSVAEGFVDAAQNRIKLLQSEIGEEADRLTGLLVLLIVAALLGLLTLQFVALVVLALLWETPWRAPAMIALTLGAGVATAMAYRAYVARKARPKAIFATSLEELEKDREVLEKSL